jgi:phosphoribosylpyrophosphate synthetase
VVVAPDDGGVKTAHRLAERRRVRDMVSDVNKTVARIRAEQAKLRGAAGAQAATLARLNDLASHLITPSIRYSQPGLQTHITYLYSMTTMTDQKIGRDAVERYTVLRKELDERMAELKKILGE